MTDRPLADEVPQGLRNYRVLALFDSERNLLDDTFDSLVVVPGSKCRGCGGPVSFYALCYECRAVCDHLFIRGYAIKANGVAFAKSRCARCGVTGGSLPRGSDILDYCLQDNRNRNDACARCGSRDGVELHHWAPKSQFGGWQEADKWPVSWLCPPCHRTWHQTMSGYQWNAKSGPAYDGGGPVYTSPRFAEVSLP